MFNYLRVSVTDRCNFRCIYCMPEEGIEQQSHDGILRYEEMLVIIRAAVDTGVEQIRLTGGEPLVRKGIVDFVAEIAQLKKIKDLTMTTNAAFLGRFAQPLKDAGLHRVNISVDSLDSAVFKNITRTGELSEVLKGIDAAIDVGLTPVKINLVLIPGVNDHEIVDFADLAVNKGLSVRFIERMPFNKSADDEEITFISQDQVVEKLSSKYELIPANKNSYGPSSTFLIKGTKGKIGFISSRTHPFCHLCRRLRLTANGYLLPCLDSDTGVSVRNRSADEIKQIIADLYKEKSSWNKQQACYGSTFDSSLSKIGG